MIFSVLERAQVAFKRRRIHSSEGTRLEEEPRGSTKQDEPTLSSWIDQQHDALLQNDPKMETLEVDQLENSVDCEDLEKLYSSLRQNTFVTRLVFRRLDLGTKSKAILGAFLQASPSITSLNLENSGEEDQNAVLSSLQENLSIQKLRVEGSRITARVGTTFDRLLKCNKIVHDVSLCHNHFEFRAFKIFAKGLQLNTGVRYLDLSGNGLVDADIAHLCKALETNNTIEHVTLDFNNFGDPGTDSLSSFLKKSSTIVRLDVCGNRIGDYGAAAISRSLLENTSLVTMVLSFNQIGNAGAASLAKVLCSNGTVQRLWINANRIGDEGLYAIGDCLASMRALTELRIGHYYSEESGNRIVAGLEYNTSMLDLLLESPIGEETKIEEMLDFYLRRNRSGRGISDQPQCPVALWPMLLAKTNQNCSATGSPDILFERIRSKPDLVVPGCCVARGA